MIDFILQIPLGFNNINYPSENHRYGNGNKNSYKLFKTLLEKSSYRCMYCGRDISYGKTHKLNATFEKEHSIEKKQSQKEYQFLKHCKFNLGVSCSACNKLKKEKLIFLPSKTLKKQSIDKCLNKKKCNSRCSFYTGIYNKYCKDNNFLLMPDGIALTTNIMQIEYDLLRREYQPSSLFSYTTSELEILNNYIFKLDIKERNNDILANMLIQLDLMLDNSINISSIKLKNGTSNLHKNILDEIFIDFVLKFDITIQKIIVDTLYKLYIVN